MCGIRQKKQAHYTGPRERASGLFTGLFGPCHIVHLLTCIIDDMK